jgi:hypothetical protein
MRNPFVLAGTALLFTLAGLILRTSTAGSDAEAVASLTPIVVELFTSEGCSSCPPADAQLRKFDTQPLPGLQLVVLSEHVDYWNHIGWTDPYSAHAYSERQSAYGRRFHLESVYTPQMIVDGTKEFVGGNSRDAQEAFAAERQANKVAVRLSGLRLEGATLGGHLETGTLPVQSRRLDVIVALALNRAESQVTRGENAGRRLTHVAVVRALEHIGTAASGKAFSGDFVIPVPKSVSAADLRVIAFLQEPGPGRIWGAGEEKLAP